MRCEWASELMSLHLDGQPHDEAGLQAHLATCPTCQQRWRGLQSVERLLARPPMAQPPADFTARVMARLPRPAPVNPWRVLGGWLVLGLGGLALGLLVFSPLALGVWGFVQQPEFGLLAWLFEVLFQLRDLGLALLRVGNSLLTIIPPPLIVLYMVLALALATIWVAIVGHLSLGPAEQQVS